MPFFSEALVLLQIKPSIIYNDYENHFYNESDCDICFIFSMAFPLFILLSFVKDLYWVTGRALFFFWPVAFIMKTIIAITNTVTKIFVVGLLELKYFFLCSLVEFVKIIPPLKWE